MKNQFCDLRLVLLVFSCYILPSCAQNVDTIDVFSAAMKKNVRCIVIKPADYHKQKNLNVVYLLHGYGGRYDNWLLNVPSIKEYSTKFNTLIVCPDGGYNSWYFNSMYDSLIRYEHFMTKELVAFIDSKYKTVKNKKGRAITGLSMGGHGALFLSLRHKNVYGAAGSMSGVVDLSVTKKKYEVFKLLGDTILNAAAWRNHSVLNIIEADQTNLPKLIIDCGTSDGFIQSNRTLHNRLMELKISHDYIERDGRHDWKYWENALPYHLLFFQNYFNASKL